MKNGLKRIILCCAAMAFCSGCSVHRSGSSSLVKQDSARTEASYTAEYSRYALSSFAQQARQQKNISFVWVRRDTSGQPDSSGQYPVVEEAKYTDLSVTDVKLDFKSALEEHASQNFTLSGSTATFSQEDKTSHTDVDNEIPSILYAVMFACLALFLLSCVALYYTKKKT